MNAITESCGSHFMGLCKLASLGFNVVPGALLIPGLPTMEYEFEPGSGVHVYQEIRGERHHRFIRFKDLGLTPSQQ